MLLRAVSAALLAAVLTACGSNHSSTSDPTVACDWIAAATTTTTWDHARACYQAPAAQGGVDFSAQCTSSNPAAVVRTSCPAEASAGLVGCCTYVGKAPRVWTLCYYDPVLYAGQEITCRTSSFLGNPGSWSTAVPTYGPAEAAP